MPPRFGMEKAALVTNWRLFKLKRAGGTDPPKLAVARYAPALPLAVNVGAVATPEPLVMAIAVVWLPGNVPLGPLAGTENVTATPLTGLLVESLTVACKEVPKLVLTSALCELPPVAEMKTGVPGAGNATRAGPEGWNVVPPSTLLNKPLALVPA